MPRVRHARHRPTRRRRRPSRRRHDVRALAASHSGPYPAKLTERLEHWAAHAPDRVRFSRSADADGAWRAAHLRATRCARARRHRAGAARSRALRASGRSSSSRATASSTRCSRSRRCTPACRTRRSRRRTRCIARDYGTLRDLWSRCGRGWSSRPTATPSSARCAPSCGRASRSSSTMHRSPRARSRATPFARARGRDRGDRPRCDDAHAPRGGPTRSRRSSSPRDRPGGPRA